jgi:hypothetical protein
MITSEIAFKNGQHHRREQMTFITKFKALAAMTAVFAFMAGSASGVQTIVKDYTFNAGAEGDFTEYAHSGPIEATYIGGKVRLGGLTTLDQYPFAPTIVDTELMIEVVMSYRELQNQRIFGFLSNGNTGRGFVLQSDGKVRGYSDHIGAFSTATATTPDTPFILAYVRDEATGPSDRLYLDGVLIGTVHPKATMGAMNRIRLGSKASDTPSGSITTIDIDQYRVSTFTGPFNTAWLMTAPTPPPDQAPTVYMISPVDGPVFPEANDVIAKCEAFFGAGAMSVQYSIRLLPGGSWVDAGAPVGAPYTANLGPLPAGDYEIRATVTEDTGALRSGVSAVVGTFTTSPPAIIVDKSYTWNLGVETDFTRIFKTGSVEPVYADGQVTLAPGTYLNGTGLFSFPDVDANFGIEIIFSQDSATTENRWIGHIGRSGNAGFQMQVNRGTSRLHYRDDTQGTIVNHPQTINVATEFRLAIVVTSEPGNVFRKSCYLDGVLLGSDTRTRQNWALDRLEVGASRGGNTQDGGVSATTINVNEVRVFHFHEGLFDASLLLTEAEAPPNFPPEITLVTPTDNQAYLTPYDDVILSSGVLFGTSPYTVQYRIGPVGGPHVDTGAPSVTSPFTVNLGSLAAGTYEIIAGVTDSDGTPRTDDSPIHTITVAPPDSTAVLDYTFNFGAEADFLGGEGDNGRPTLKGISYPTGKVLLEGNAWLDSTAVLPTITDSKIIIEAIVSFPAHISNRKFGFFGSGSGGIGFDIYGTGDVYGYSDQVGARGSVAVAVDEEVRLAWVHDSTKSPERDRFYVNGVLVNTGNGNEFGTFTQVRLGTKQNGNGGNDGTSVAIDQYRVSTFTGEFHPSVLMTAPTSAVGSPSDITLAPLTVDENATAGTEIGTLATVQDPQDPGYTYTEAAGAGDGDNGLITIVGDKVQVDGVIDYETNPTLEIRVQTQDNTGRTRTVELVIAVQPQNDTPTDIALSPSTVVENSVVGTEIGTLTSTDDDVGDTFTYTLVSGAGDADNGLVSIAVDKINVAGLIDFETNPTLEIRVQSEDAAGATYEEALTITVTGVSETFMMMAAGEVNVDENAVGTIRATGDSASIVYTKTGGFDAAKFSITAGGVLTMDTAPVAGELGNTYYVEVTATGSTPSGGPVKMLVEVTVVSTGSNATIFIFQ